MPQFVSSLKISFLLLLLFEVCVSSQFTTWKNKFSFAFFFLSFFQLFLFLFFFSSYTLHIFLQFFFSFSSFFMLRTAIRQGDKYISSSHTFLALFHYSACCVMAFSDLFFLIFLHSRSSLSGSLLTFLQFFFSIFINLNCDI